MDDVDKVLINTKQSVLSTPIKRRHVVTKKKATKVKVSESIKPQKLPCKELQRKILVRER